MAYTSSTVDSSDRIAITTAMNALGITSATTSWAIVPTLGSKIHIIKW